MNAADLLRVVAHLGEPTDAVRAEAQRLAAILTPLQPQDARRAAWLEALAEHRAAVEARRALHTAGARHRVQMEFERVVEAAADATFTGKRKAPKGRPAWSEEVDAPPEWYTWHAKHTPDYAQIRERFAAEAKRITEEALDRVDKAQERMLQAAEHVTPRASDEVWCAMRPHAAGSYASTGNGGTYARALAELDADAARALGLEAVVVGAPTGPTRGHLLAYRAWVSCDPDELSIVEARPLPLPEQVRRLWAHGANPRVILPGLPHDYERRHGFDYHGRKVQ